MDSTVSKEEKKASDLCINCGMCCDGTLFTKAPIYDLEDREVTDKLELTAFESGGKLLFKLPCHHFSGCCTVYNMQRPKICSAFFCLPLQKSQRGEHTFEDAKQQISALLQYRNLLLEKATQFPETKGLSFRELKATLEEFSTNIEKVKIYKHLFLVLFLFEDVRKKYFKFVRKEKAILNDKDSTENHI